jgi:hypothetical protein
MSPSVKMSRADRNPWLAKMPSVGHSLKYVKINMFSQKLEQYMNNHWMVPYVIFSIWIKKI